MRHKKKGGDCTGATRKKCLAADAIGAQWPISTVLLSSVVVTVVPEEANKKAFSTRRLLDMWRRCQEHTYQPLNKRRAQCIASTTLEAVQRL